MSFWAPPPEPKTGLGRHRVLAPTAAVKVSPLCLGAMNFGTAWEPFLGECSKETAFEMLDFFYENGGNFIDTANNYQNEQSETWIGDWMEKHNNRDEIVLATKYTSGYRTYTKKGIQSNLAGNNSKSMKLSVEASLKKLKTDYIDLFYVHWWDETISIEELMQSLNQLVATGKVIYLGISDTPAWIVSKANQYARDHGLRPFSVYQGQWSASLRDFERDILPMCEAEGMGIAPWGSLGRGNYKTEEQLKSKIGGRQSGGPTENDVKVSKVLEPIAKRLDTDMTSIALAYVMHKAPYVFPIVGGRKVEHLKGNAAALDVKLTDKDLGEIDEAYPFDIGFPLSMTQGGPNPKTVGPQNVPLIRPAGHFDYVEKPRAIGRQ